MISTMPESSLMLTRVRASLNLILASRSHVKLFHVLVHICRRLLLYQEEQASGHSVTASAAAARCLQRTVHRAAAQKTDLLLLSLRVFLAQCTCHPSHVLAADRASLKPGFSPVSAGWTMLSCIMHWGTSERSHLRHLVHSRNHKEWDTGLCDRMTRGSANTCTTASPSQRSPTVSVGTSVHTSAPIYMGKESLRRGMNFCPYLHQVQICA